MPGLGTENHFNDFYRGLLPTFGRLGCTLPAILAKSGVGGGVMAVLPGVWVFVFAPPVGEAGNSVKAQLAVKFDHEQARSVDLTATM